MQANDRARAYHERSKHRLSGYAAGPQTLDWDAQPDPFRCFEGAALTPLPLVADALATPWRALATPGRVQPQPFNRDSVAAWLELSLGLTAWKQSGPDRWALRAHPSSGNLHPTETYVLCTGVAGLADGLHHYQPREHALALRRPGVLAGAAPQLWLGLSAIHWREAWKYGERAFRYCQLDTGHALGALCYAAAVLGWSARVLEGISHQALAALLGLDRDEDFGTAESEEPELLLQIGAATGHGRLLPGWLTAGAWAGKANRLDARPMYRWPVIDDVASATRAPERRVEPPPAERPAPVLRKLTQEVSGTSLRGDTPASTLIRQRRSAQRFDRSAQMPLACLTRMLAALQPGAGLPWDSWPHRPRVHLVLWAHRLAGLAPGAYLLARGEATAAAQGLLASPGAEPLSLAPGVLLRPCGQHPALAQTLRRLSCHQAIAADACFAVSLLADFDLPAAWVYRELLQEAGLIGQVLYLQAEAEGYRGTGIGCYFDDAVHELLALKDAALQVLYQFTVGQAVFDERIQSEPPYAGRAVVEPLPPEPRNPP